MKMYQMAEEYSQQQNQESQDPEIFMSSFANNKVRTWDIVALLRVEVWFSPFLDYPMLDW